MEFVLAGAPHSSILGLLLVTFLIITCTENVDQIPEDTKFGGISNDLKYRYEIKNDLDKINQLAESNRIILNRNKAKIQKSRRIAT